MGNKNIEGSPVESDLALSVFNIGERHFTVELSFFLLYYYLLLPLYGYLVRGAELPFGYYFFS